jgi:hypothetical protein
MGWKCTFLWKMLNQSNAYQDLHNPFNWSYTCAHTSHLIPSVEEWLHIYFKGTCVGDVFFQLYCFNWHVGFQEFNMVNLIPSVEEWLYRILTEFHLNQGKSRLVINYITSFHVRDQVRLQSAQTLRMIKTITNKIQFSKSLLYTATQSTSLFTFWK